MAEEPDRAKATVLSMQVYPLPKKKETVSFQLRHRPHLFDKLGVGTCSRLYPHALSKSDWIKKKKCVIASAKDTQPGGSNMYVN